MSQLPHEQAEDENTPTEILSQLAHESIELAIIVAKNPSATPELLRELSFINNIKIRESLVSNPNTPKDILFELAGEFPQEFIANPILDLLLLENPQLPLDISYWTLRKLLTLKEVPGWLLTGAAVHPNSEIVYFVARHPQTSIEILHQIIPRSHDDVRIGICISQRGDVTLEILEVLAKDSPIPVKLHLAKQDNTPPSVLTILADSTDKNWNVCLELHVSVAKHPHTPIAVLSQLLASGEFKIKRAIAMRENLPKSLFVALAMDYRIYAMNILPQNHSISATLLTELSTHPELHIRQIVAAHPNTPTPILEQAVNEQALHDFLAQNPKVPIPVLEQILSDASIKIKNAIAQNPVTPSHLLDQLAQTHDHDLLILIARHHHTDNSTLERILQRLAFDTRLSVHKFVAKHPHTPVDILRNWAEKHPQLRPWIAQNPNLPPDILANLAKDPSYLVRCEVAKNHNTDPKVLTDLAQDPEPEIRQAIAKNPHAPPAALNLLVLDWYCVSLVARHPNTPAQALAHLARLGGYEWLVVRHLNTSPVIRTQILNQLARSYNVSDRLYAAQNPHTHSATLEELAKDHDIKVSQAALHNLQNRSE